MPHKQNQEPTKAQVQTTKLNKMPIPGKFDPDFSAEAAAEVFEENPAPQSASASTSASETNK